MPAVAFAGDNVTAAKTVTVVWDTTRDDPGNLLADVYIATQTGGGGFGPATIQPITFKTAPSDVIRWTASVTFTSTTPPFINAATTGAALTWDYQHLGSWFFRGAFLALWGGDARLWPMDGNKSVIMSDFTQ